MNARVYVTLKKSVFDPQGKTIHDALRSMGYSGVAVLLGCVHHRWRDFNPDWNQIAMNLTQQPAKSSWKREGILRLRLFFALVAQRTILAQDDMPRYFY